MYFVLKILKILFTLFLSPCIGHHCAHHQELLSCTCSLWSRVVLSSLCPPVLLCCKLQHSRTGGHNEPSTTRDQRLNFQLRSSWWWTQWCPKHVERNNVNKILRIFKTKYIWLAFYSSYHNDVRNREPEKCFELLNIWEQLHNEELNDLYSLPNIVWVVKSRRMRWAGHVARMDVCIGCWWEILRERGHWGDQDVDGRVILRWIFRKLEGVVGTGRSWLRTGTGGGHLWVLWGTFGFHKCGEFLD